MSALLIAFRINVLTAFTSASRSIPLPSVSRSIPLPPASRSIPLAPASRGIPLPSVSRSIPVASVSHSIPLPSISRSIPLPPASRGIPLLSASHSIPRSVVDRNPQHCGTVLQLCNHSPETEFLRDGWGRLRATYRYQFLPFCANWGRLGQLAHRSTPWNFEASHGTPGSNSGKSLTGVVPSRSSSVDAHFALKRASGDELGKNASQTILDRQSRTLPNRKKQHI